MIKVNEKNSNYFTKAQNMVQDPKLTNYTNNFIPTQKIEMSLSPYPDNWFQPVTFPGAFGEDNWISRWTALSEL